MIKISLCILAVYLMYYAGNIAYDLFLKKEKEIHKEETEEFSLSEISEQYEELTATIGIEDVENLNTPKSFNKNPLYSDFTERNEERQELEYLRKLFESEQDLDEPDNTPKKASTETENPPYPEKTAPTEVDADAKGKTSNEQEIQESTEVIQRSQIITNKEAENSGIKEIEERDSPIPLKKEKQESQWKAMLNLSETLVQMVANYDGYKVYQSTM